MNESTRNQLDAKLKKILNQFEQAQSNQKQTIFQTGTGNIIRRRKGTEDKRLSDCTEP